MASTSGVADAATRSLLMSIRRTLIHCCSMYVKNLRSTASPLQESRGGECRHVDGYRVGQAPRVAARERHNQRHLGIARPTKHQRIARAQSFERQTQPA